MNELDRINDALIDNLTEQVEVLTKALTLEKSINERLQKHNEWLIDRHLERGCINPNGYKSGCDCPACGGYNE